VEKKMLKVVEDKSRLFANNDSECHELKVDPSSDDILKIWIKQPTWLQVEQAVASVMNIDANTQKVDIDLNKMYKFMVREFIDKTEPSLSTLELLKLSPYIGKQLKEILPNPLADVMGDDTGKEKQ
tara:strand:- start:1183 stop:1560 length:378 start_codon:yes stop_codon:yes gene_type:complete